MHSVGLKALENGLSEYLRLAAEGETVLVTDRDRVVAEIDPPQAGRGPFLADAILAEAVRDGWLTPAALAGGGAPPRKPVMAFRDLMKDLRGDREERDLSDSSVALAYRPKFSLAFVLRFLGGTRLDIYK
jgi:antitoxin (DNA-binding transcriptional repressor) of toxin-antitoxin stability system